MTPDKLKTAIIAELGGRAVVGADDLHITIKNKQPTSIIWRGDNIKAPFHRGLIVSDDYLSAQHQAARNIAWMTLNHDTAVDMLRVLIERSGNMIRHAGGMSGAVMPTAVSSFDFQGKEIVALTCSIEATLLNNALEREKHRYTATAHLEGRVTFRWDLQGEMRHQSERRARAGRAIEIDTTTRALLSTMTAEQRRKLLDQLLIDARVQSGSVQITGITQEWRTKLKLPDAIEAIDIINGRIKAKVRLGPGVIWTAGRMKITRQLPTTLMAGMKTLVGRKLREIVDHPAITTGTTITKVHISPGGMVVLSTDEPWIDFNPEVD